MDLGMQRRSERALVFMTKWPEPGRAKTRLAPPLTPVEAADLARCFLLDTLDAAEETGFDRLLGFSPASAWRQFRDLVGSEVGLIPAEAGELGGALRLAQRTALAAGYREVALVASDLPHLAAERYQEAFALLDAADVVIGPSGDGGYYLLAARAATPTLFDGIAWSTATVYERTLECAAEANLRVGAIAGCDDVDGAADLLPLLACLRVRPRAGRTLTQLEGLPWIRAMYADGSVLRVSASERIGHGSSSRRDAAGIAAG
jgi:rSAM/selenodomain-associated transferase 1